MRRKTLKKTLIISFSVLIFLFVVLCLHIYVVMKPKPASDKTIAMARIDFKQQIDQQDANKISAWLYAQKDVQHVLCNQKAGIAVFSFYPSKISADKIASDLSSALHYKAVRYKPDEKEMAKSCPAMGSSFAYKIYSIMKNAF